MKQLSVLMAGVILATMVFASCEKQPEGGKTPGTITEEVQFSASSGLSVTVSGRTVNGCTAKYTPAEDGSATITLEGEKTGMNGELMSLITELLKSSENIFVSDVLPGSATVTMDVKPEFTGDMGKFEGTGSNNYCSYSYTGEVSKSRLSIVFKDVKLDAKGGAIVGTSWDIVSPGKSWKDMFILESTPETELSTALGLALTAAPLLGYNLQELFAEMFEGFNFYEDGDVTIDYFDDGAAVSTESPHGIVDYVSLGSKQIRLFPNAGAFFDFFRENPILKSMPSAETLNTVIDIAAKFMIDIDKKGIVAEYKISGNKMEIYFKEDVMIEFLKTVDRIFLVDGVKDALMEYIGAELGGDVTKLIGDLFPLISKSISKTNSFKLGLKLERS